MIPNINQPMLHLLDPHPQTPSLLITPTLAESMAMGLRRMIRRKTTLFQTTKDLAYLDRYTLPRTEDRDATNVSWICLREIF
jgi:hypothetical protein